MRFGLGGPAVDTAALRTAVFDAPWVLQLAQSAGAL